MTQVIYGTEERRVEACVGGVSEDWLEKKGGKALSIDCPLLHGPAGAQHHKFQAGSEASASAAPDVWSNYSGKVDEKERNVDIYKR